MKNIIFLFLILSLISFSYEVTLAQCNSNKNACINKCKANLKGATLSLCQIQCLTNYNNCRKNVK